MCKNLQERLDAQWGVVKEGRQRVGREIKHNTEGLACRFKDKSPLGRSTEGPLPSGFPQLKSPAWSRKRKRDDKDDASKKKILDYLGKATCPDGQCVQCGQSSHCRCPCCPRYIGHVCSNCKNRGDISWIGSLQVFLLFFLGTVAGRLTDAGKFRIVFCVGSVLTCLGIFMASISTTYWQYLLAQGICTGVGNGFLFTPALAIVGTYFKERRALAFGITATGTATGGLIFPTMARQLLPQMGLGWTLRSMGLIQVITLGIANICLKRRLPPKPKQLLVDCVAFKDFSYTFFACGMFCVCQFSFFISWNVERTDRMKAFWGMYFCLLLYYRFC
jgi:hypothetical protein